MNDSTKMLALETTVARVPAQSRKRVLQLLSDLLAAQNSDLSERGIFEALMARERLGSSGFCEGVAIPHCRTVCDRIYSAFFELEEGVDGLIHISDLSWSKKIKHPAEFTKIGEDIEVVVLDIDEENRRLSLGHKQLEENPWDVFETVFTIDSVHQGTVINANDKGAVVSLPYGVEGFAPARHLKKEDGSTIKGDETADFKVIEFSKDNKKIILSHTRLFEEDPREAKAREAGKAKDDAKKAKRNVKKVNEKLEKTTFGDLDVLADLKTDMEKEEKAKK